jgi:hypothetical protein
MRPEFDFDTVANLEFIYILVGFVFLSAHSARASAS